MNTHGWRITSEAWVKTDVDGGVLRVSWACSEGHFGFWMFSQKLCEKNSQDIHVNTLLLAAAVLISGKNFNKMDLFCKFLGLNFISKSTYNRIQTHNVNQNWMLIGKK